MGLALEGSIHLILPQSGIGSNEAIKNTMFGLLYNVRIHAMKGTGNISDNPSFSS